jgi:hypothetical protein
MKYNQPPNDQPQPEDSGNDALFKMLESTNSGSQGIDKQILALIDIQNKQAQDLENEGIIDKAAESLPEDFAYNGLTRVMVAVRNHRLDAFVASEEEYFIRFTNASFGTKGEPQTENKDIPVVSVLSHEGFMPQGDFSIEDAQLVVGFAEALKDQKRSQILPDLTPDLASISESSQRRSMAYGKPKHLES